MRIYTNKLNLQTKRKQAQGCEIRIYKVDLYYWNIIHF